MVLEYVPETVYHLVKHYSKANQQMRLIYVKLYTSGSLRITFMITYLC